MPEAPVRINDAPSRQLFESLLIPKYADYLSLMQSNNDWITLGYPVRDQPAGLLIASLNSSIEWSRIYYLYIHPDYRRQGIATVLLDELEQLSKENNITTQEWLYRSNDENVSGLEALFRKRGLSSPRPRVLECTTDRRLFDTPFLKNHMVDSSASIKPWTEITGMIPEPIQVSDNKVWIPTELHPAHFINSCHQELSFGMMDQGMMKAWIITHQLGPNRLQVTSSYCDPQYQSSGGILPLFAHACQAAAKEDWIEEIIWTVSFSFEEMVAFTKNRLGPHLTSIVETREAFKTLR